MAELDNIGVTVELHVYDLTKGLAASLSQMLLGEAIFGSITTTFANLCCKFQANTWKACGTLESWPTAESIFSVPEECKAFDPWVYAFRFL